MEKFTFRQLITVLAVVITLAVNGLANAIPLNGQTTGAVSDQFQVYFVPAGYVFSIWGIIYIGLILFAIYQALPSQRTNPRLQRLSSLFPLSCLANIAWLFLWHYEYFIATLVAMTTLLLSLIGIYLHLNIGRADVPKAEKWLVHIPMSLYLGWITVATIANATSVLDYLNWNGWGIGAETWTIIMLIVATGISLAVGLTRGDSIYLLVIIWAFAGIGVKHSSTPVIARAAWISTSIVGLLLIGNIIRQRQPHLRTKS